MRVRQVNPKRLADLRGLRSREWVAHELRSRGHSTDAKTIWRWERGRNAPNTRVLPDLAEVLGARSVEELYEDDAEAASMAPLTADTTANIAEALEALAAAYRAFQPLAERAPESGVA